MGLLGGQTTSLKSAQTFREGMFFIGLLIGVLLSLIVLLPGIIWATILSWSLSSVLFGANLIAILLSIWLLVLRPSAVVLQHKFIPRGLGIHECQGALMIV
jgi:hypothetical protein